VKKQSIHGKIVMPETSSIVRPRILKLDFLRGFAILYIVGVHHLDDYAGNIYHSQLELITTKAFLGMFVFISGYLLSMNNPINNRDDVLNFTFKRFLRIYPLYALALLLFMFCSLMSFESMLLHMAFLNVLVNKSGMTLWFVTIICIFYLFYPILVYRYSLLKTTAVFLVFCLIVVPLNRMFGLFDIRLPIYFPLFLLGVESHKHDLIEKYLHISQVLSLLLICMPACFLFPSLFYKINENNAFILILFMISTLPILLFLGEIFCNLLKESVYQKLAYASFCMYLFHRVIFRVMLNYYSPDTNFAKVVYLTGIGMPLIFMTSFYFQRYYDRVTARWKRT
jgi:peptidoglycan/LPS O-acetylase OafA/YrhL